MRQREAHAALRRFLKSAQGKGYRHVLVITGKGTAIAKRGGASTRRTSAACCVRPCRIGWRHLTSLMSW